MINAALKTAAPVIMSLVLLAAGIEGDAFDYPVTPARMLADSLAESCEICARKTRKEAYALLEKEFPPGRLFRAPETRPFIKAPVGGGALFPWGGQKRVLYLKMDGTGRDDIFLPLVFFRFHTEKNHLVGIERDDYTDASIEERIAALPASSGFRGSVKIIRFRYGDGSSFSFSQGENALYIHCKIESAEFASGRKHGK